MPGTTLHLLLEWNEVLGTICSERLKTAQVNTAILTKAKKHGHGVHLHWVGVKDDTLFCTQEVRNAP